MAAVLPVSDANFEAEVLKASLPVLVDFWAPWCGPCRMVGPVVDKLAQEYDGKLKVCKVNTDESHEIPGKYDIHGIPTLIIFKRGAEVERMVGYMPEPALKAKIDPHVALAAG